ncbi:MAG TPA: S41 family peptidase, partial [Verrucomicrobiae bacterium]|nr:S41 family peptidase [Verrucomicrobiae bacterium]
MNRMRLSGFVTAVSLALAVGVCGLSASETNGTPNFQEIYGLIRAHVAGVSDQELNQAAVDGLLNVLHSKVVLVPASGRTNATEQSPLVSEGRILEDNIAYVRVGRVDSGLDNKIRAAYDRLNATNKLQGVVLDLRYAKGADYSAAVGAADLFIGKTEPLLDWGNGVVKSGGNSNVITLPLAVLVNHETSGAAEALAAMLREGKVGLIIGVRTAGGAMMFQAFSLKNGDELRVATAPVKLGDGDPLPMQGIKPDIQVSVSPEQGRIYYADPYKTLGKSDQVAGAGNSSTNSEEGAFVPRVRMNEAELVREHRQETNLSTEIDRAPKRRAEPAKPVVRDPVLGRALDLLKGLAIVREG